MPSRNRNWRSLASLERLIREGSSFSPRELPMAKHQNLRPAAPGHVFLCQDRHALSSMKP